MGRQKVSKSDFQSQFSMSKNVRIFLKKNFIEKYQFKTTSFVKYIFWWLQNWTTFVTKMTSNFWRSLWTSVKVKSKNYFSFTDLFAKIKSLLTHVRKTPPLRSHYKCLCIIWMVPCHKHPIILPKLGRSTIDYNVA